MELTLKNKIIIGVAVVGVSFAGGRFSTPVKTVVETKTVEVEKKDDKSKISKRKDLSKVTKTVTHILPSGEKTIETTSTIKANGSTDTSQDVKSAATNDTQSKTTTVVDGGKTTVMVLAGKNVTDVSPLVYGASVYKPIIGPVGIGVWGLSNLTFGASAGISF